MHIYIHYSHVYSAPKIQGEDPQDAAKRRSACKSRPLITGRIYGTRPVNKSRSHSISEASYLQGSEASYLQGSEASYLQGSEASYLQGSEASYLQPLRIRSLLYSKPLIYIPKPLL